MIDWIVQYMGDRTLAKILDIVIVWFIIYQVLLWVRGTRMMNLLKGVAIIFIAKVLSSIIGLQTIDWLLNQIISWGVIASIILFQPEIRKALETLGKNLFRNKRLFKNPSDKLINDLEKSVIYMARRKIGALIVIEAEDSLEEFINTGIDLDAYVSSQLLINIFIPNTPLHDGAVIISDFRVAAASAYLPLSESMLIPKELGTRHRAAIGLGEATDALTIIVSEETGAVSLVKRDHLHRDIQLNELSTFLYQYLNSHQEEGAQEKSMIDLLREFITNSFVRKW